MNHFTITGPTVLQVSGGRTSGVMLDGYLKAHGGKLPEDTVVLFENTGKEREETLEFVNEIATRWNVNIHWLEWLPPLLPDGRIASPADWDGFERDVYEEEVKIGPLFGKSTGPQLKRHRAPPRKLTRRFREVNFATASRKGEPFEALIDWLGFLPNTTSKTCTQHLKIRTQWAFVEERLGWAEWDTAVGIRYDEPARWKSLGVDMTNKRETKIGPLKEARITEDDVMNFWACQPFDLQLQQYEGNCDLCPWKGRAKRMEIMRAAPERADWWIRQQERMVGKTRSPGGASFRLDEPSIRQLRTVALGQGRLPIFNDAGSDAVPCGCAG